MHTIIKMFAAFTLFCLLSPVTAPAQGTGSIHGLVYDVVTREPLIGANVVLMETPLGSAADLDGNFKIMNIAPGTYRLQVSMIGYKSRILTDIIVAAGKMTELQIPLEAMTIGIGEVVVEADYFYTNADAPVSVQTLSSEEIRRAPGGLEDVVRAIAVLPGVAQPSSGRNDLIVRGGAASENLYVIDNLEVPNINHFGTQGATGGPLSFINVDYVREVTFSTGGFGPRYGDKLSSVTSIELAQGRSDRIGGKATISATQFGLNTEGPIGEGGSFLFSARRSYLDFIFKAAGFGFVPEYWDFLGKATFSLDKENSFSVLTIGVLDDVEFFSDTEEQRYSNSRVLGNAQNQYFTGFSWRRLLDHGYITTTLGRTFVDYDFLQSDSLLNPVFRSKSKEGETSLRADGVFLLDHSYELSFGASGKYIRLEGDFLFPEGAAIPFTQPVIRSNAWDTAAYKISAYAQISKEILSRLDLTLGGRFDYFNMIDRPVVFSPRASVRYGVSQLTTLTLSGGVYHQAPSYIWLLSNPLNTRLNHIEVRQVVAGIEHLLRDDLRIRLEGYVKQYADYPASETRRYLVLANTGAGFGGSDDDFASFGLDPLISGGEGQTRGVELLLQKRLSDVPLYGVLSVSYNQAMFTALDGVERAGAFDQRVILNLSGGWKIDENWEASAKFRFGTGMPYSPYNEDGSKNIAEYNGERLPSVHALDLRVDRRWSFTNWNLIAFIDVQNVYNRKNTQGYQWDFRNRVPKATGNSIGILPAIGVSAEF